MSEPLKTIHELATIAGNNTDKQDATHSFSGENYLHFYERHFESRRLEPLKVLEIGVGFGASLRLWRDYFPNAQVNGLDIRPDAVVDLGERIKVHTGDQNDAEMLKELSNAHGPFDIVIDDGSHLVEHMITSFNVLFERMPKSAIYAMEDMRCTYYGADSGWLGMTLNAEGTNFDNDRSKLDTLFLPLIHAIDNQRGELKSFCFYSMVSILTKRDS
jgi:hypothetical protein